MSRKLTRLPVELSAEWLSKTVTTDPPRLTPHEEWRPSVTLTAEAPLRAAVMLKTPEGLTWGLWGRGREPSDVLELPFHFFAYDWPNSDEMQLSFGSRRLRLTDRALKDDPRGQTSLLFPPTAMTGEVVPVCEVPRHGIVAEVIAFAAADTEERRRDRCAFARSWQTSYRLNWLS